MEISRHGMALFVRCTGAFYLLPFWKDTPRRMMYAYGTLGNTTSIVVMYWNPMNTIYIFRL